ncbi:protein NDR1-like [Amaranthus tricolor]|uniref:protein NDR1-like n=1 Tax=Amaranthus tricolor TaxID=29722 RepID=UPI002584E008|nr:protein NDR1-like [Amaranthus tricolor]
MPRRTEKGLCSTCISLGTTIFFLWFVFSSKSPKCSIQEFKLLLPLKSNQTTTKISISSPLNNTIHYDLKLKNRNFNKGIYYDALNLTFFYKSNLNGINLPIGNTTFSPFYQGRSKATHRLGNITSTATTTTSNVAFRVEMATAIRCKGTLWKSKRHRFVVGVDFKVNDEGVLVKGNDNKGIVLSSSSRKNGIGKGVLGVMGILGIFFNSHLVILILIDFSLIGV